MRILLVLAMMGWGLVWPLSKMLLEFGSPAQIASLRYVLVSVCFIPLMLCFKIPFSIPKPARTPLLLTGALNALYSYLMYVGMPYGDSGHAGVITEVLSPIIAALLWSAYTRQSLSASAHFGLALGVLACAFLIDFFGNMRAIFSAFYMIYMLAALDWALLMLASRKATHSLNAITLNFYSSLMTCALLAPALFLPDSSMLGVGAESSVMFLAALVDKPLAFYAFLAVAAVFCTVFATTIFYKALFVLGVVEGGIYALLVPIFSLGFAYMLLGEIPSLSTIIGGILAIISIYLINYFKR